VLKRLVVIKKILNCLILDCARQFYAFQTTFRDNKFKCKPLNLGQNLNYFKIPKLVCVISTNTFYLYVEQIKDGIFFHITLVPKIIISNIKTIKSIHNQHLKKGFAPYLLDSLFHLNLTQERNDFMCIQFCRYM